MSGIWDYVTVTGDETQRRVNVSLLRTALTGVALGLATREQAKASIEAKLGVTIAGAAATDLAALADLFETGTSAQRLVYAAKCECVLNAAELGLINETTFRTWLGIA